MSYLLDTCVLSELIKPVPDAGVLAWVDRQAEHTLFMSVLTLGELQKGISKLADGRRRRELASWVDEDLRRRFDRRILEVTLETALQWGKLQGSAEKRGRAIPVVDALIGATGIVHGLTVVTRNCPDLEGTGVGLINPWDLG